MHIATQIITQHAGLVVHKDDSDQYQQPLLTSPAFSHCIIVTYCISLHPSHLCRIKSFSLIFRSPPPKLQRILPRVPLPLNKNSPPVLSIKLSAPYLRSGALKTFPPYFYPLKSFED
ncbi:hypothetical protein JR316_0012048 [Psilocybe cubensis]|uniref:Uncharacterized protein n=2 Tax=Psilocybe cubensis TaxID=181762 RepID=A0ACB8GIQ3_PSICU|nr:uncharacterized protein JR316_0013408 [Psilocybe cubensis]XP_047742574.1 hypothetical protein JR316_0012048 [Psilocybe cubensis]KAH9474245.1 hypothetical protein JR316_0013408 [Psilocybe cubensis]KAH9474949.1 hypothetical protein JR316_0012048 [Psilocybe cubensis]